VIHSVTKYLSGHGNLTAGVVCGNDLKLMKSAIRYRRYTGHMLSADDAYRLSTQILTFSLRFKQQCRNAEAVAGLLNRSDMIGRVWYPGLKDHPAHDEAKSVFGNKGFGGMITFDFTGKSVAEKRKRRDKFIKSVSGKIKLIPTLGDPRTILMPVESVWGEKYPEPGMLRMSLGFEETEEITETITSALKTIN
jgi:cystathionine beta-lyase/cystathionine gamma-synthase